MAKNCAAFIPERITAGLSLALAANYPAFPAPAWEVSVLLRGPKAITLTAIADGARHVLNVAADETKSWPAGEYWYMVRATNGSVVSEVSRGRTILEPDFADLPDGTDMRTQNEVALDSINAVLAKRATLDQERYRINNRELFRTPISELMRLKAFYTAAVRRERGSQGCGSSWRNIPVKFS